MRIARPLVALAFVTLVVASCEPSHSPVAPYAPSDALTGPFPETLPAAGDHQTDAEEYELCKVGSDADFSYTTRISADGVTFGPTNPALTVHLANGECKVLYYNHSGEKKVILNVTETTPQSGFHFVQIVDTTVSAIGTSQPRTVRTLNTATVEDTIAVGPTGIHGALSVYFNAANPTGQIGDFVWSDANGNGIQDAGEAGIAGLTVTLGGSASATTTTDATGHYLFSGLDAGSYTVTVATPAGFTASPSTAGTDTTIDSNGSPANVTLATPTSSNLTIDFGFTPAPTGSIGDFVWKDLNGNGVQDAGEPGIGGLTVTLTGPVTASTTTNGSGQYLFSGLPAGSYVVTVATPAGYTVSPTGAGTPATDNNGSPAPVTLPTFGSIDLTIDFGFVPIPPAQLSVNKTPDNGSFAQNGQASFTIVVSNPGTGLAATNVALNDALPGNGGLVWQTATTTQGSCTITSNSLSCSLGTLAAGASATVTVSSTATTPLAACTSQPNPAAIATADGPLTAQDAGSLNCTPAAPQLKVVKTPDNGTFTQGSQISYNIIVSNPGTGLAASNVQLSDALPGNGGLVWQTATTTQGSCSITSNALSCSLGSIAAGASATVTVSSTTTTPNAACTSQPNPAAIATATGGLTAQDAGSLSCTPPPPTGQIGDFVWKDVDGDGIQDAGETGIAGVTVTLSGPVSASTTTNASGNYLFSNLPAGTYTVSVGTPSGLTPTIVGAGTPATDNNGSPALVTLPTNSSVDLTIDFGFKPLVQPPTTVTVCKIGTSASFTLGNNNSYGGGGYGGGGGGYNSWGNSGYGGSNGGSNNNTFTLQDGGCKVVDTHVIGTSTTTVMVTENVPQNTALDSIIVQGPSGKQKLTGKTSVSVSSSDAGSTNVTFYNHLIPPHHSGHGCSSSYYQDSNHHGAYTGGYSPHTQFTSVFGGNAYQGKTLDDVLHFTSHNGSDALAREAVAAFLSAQNPDVGYSMTTGQVIRTFTSAYGSRNYDGGRQTFESWNTDNDDQ